uniref:F-box domain-containing protein n=1 Tax=Chromera velia CCMP2878 TaxID=1169474 RepID=A0A0G4IEQ1_9ALVE|eukprot:Cvel_13703.t1-p1 / transcript=Cvel_13703.t1 / gene=Cvel_13703 / organism=Chromera_velia_CCMP2878 / gene_product=hypothetical protein / transcript_product=hypothetical protein / location=Cvel_scaffold947:21614-23059(-) / protein_length=482 / sequence_SO=supercontig / SO=protein_coding / is_pseudo=false
MSTEFKRVQAQIEEASEMVQSIQNHPGAPPTPYTSSELNAVFGKLVAMRPTMEKLRKKAEDSAENAKTALYGPTMIAKVRTAATRYEEVIQSLTEFGVRHEETPPAPVAPSSSSAAPSRPQTVSVTSASSTQALSASALAARAAEARRDAAASSSSAPPPPAASPPPAPDPEERTFVVSVQELAAVFHDCLSKCDFWYSPSSSSSSASGPEALTNSGFFNATYLMPVLREAPWLYASRRQEATEEDFERLPVECKMLTLGGNLLIFVSADEKGEAGVGPLRARVELQTGMSVALVRRLIDRDILSPFLFQLQPPSLSALSLETVCTVLSFLKVKELGRALVAGRSLCAASENESLWHAVSLRVSEYSRFLNCSPLSEEKARQYARDAGTGVSALRFWKAKARELVNGAKIEEERREEERREAEERRRALERMRVGNPFATRPPPRFPSPLPPFGIGGDRDLNPFPRNPFGGPGGGGGFFRGL